MTDLDTTRQLLALVAPRIPAIWDVVGPASLNPQPLPPIDTELNPQPLPPGPPPETYGAVVGRELVRLAWLADKLGTDVTPLAQWADDPVPAYPAAPALPPWLPAVREPNEAWLDGYYLGLACALALSAPGRSLAGSSAGVVGEVLTRAVQAIGGGVRS